MPEANRIDRLASNLNRETRRKGALAAAEARRRKRDEVRQLALRTIVTAHVDAHTRALTELESLLNDKRESVRLRAAIAIVGASSGADHLARLEQRVADLEKAQEERAA